MSLIQYPQSEGPLYRTGNVGPDRRAANERQLMLVRTWQSNKQITPRLVWGTQLLAMEQTLNYSGRVLEALAVDAPVTDEAYNALNLANHLDREFWAARRRNMVLIGLGLFGLLGYGAYSLVRRK